jgi:zinc transporter 1/2/3
MYVSLHLGFVRFTNMIQLFTHAELFFSNDCIEGIEYEATAGAIMIAGLFITFIIEYIAHRWVDLSESSSSEQHYSPKSLTLNTTVMEAGIIFHSICKYHQSVAQRISIR